MGRAAEAERWSDVAPGSIDGLLADGSPLDSWVAFLDAYLCRRGVTQMRADAELARERLAPDSPFQGSALFLEAISYLFDGDVDAADPILARAAEVCLRMGGIPTASLAVAERAVVAIERHDWHAAESFADEALAIVQAGHCEDYLTSTLVYAVAGRTAVHGGDVAGATDHVARASRLRPLCTYIFPPRPSSCSNSVTPISSCRTQQAPGRSSARSVTFSTTAPTWASFPSWPTSCSPWSTPSMTEQWGHRR